MGILELPVEIFHLIADLTLPDGIENLVLSCKTVYIRAKTQIRMHNRLRKWKITSNPDGPSRGDTLSIIYQISREPLIAQYIEALYLWDRRNYPAYDQLNIADYDASDWQIDTAVAGAIKDMFSKSELFADRDLDALWNLAVQEDPSDGMTIGLMCTTILLLSFLPNLRKLQLPDEWYEVRKGEAAEELVPLVESLVELTNTRQLASKGLMCLDTLFPFVEEGYEFRIGLQSLQPFMALESIRNLYAVSCVAVKQDMEAIPFDWPNSRFQSSLTRIELAYCCIDAPALASIFVVTPGLRIFRYSHQTKWFELGHDWNPGEVLDTIADFYGPRLLELALTIDDLDGAVVNGLSSFLRLSKLEKLEVDVESFCGPPLESGQRRGRDATAVPEGSKAWAHDDIPCLASMLPATIREIHVNAFHPGQLDEALRALFKNLKHRRAETLPLLHTVIIRQWGDGVWETSIAEDYGITLEVFERPDHCPRTIMPLWKRQFDGMVGGIIWGNEH